MRVLLDTNIVIPMEPTSSRDLEETTIPSLELSRLCNQRNISIYIHPVNLVDLQKDKDKNRSELRNVLLKRYPQLNTHPVVDILPAVVVGNPQVNSNSWVDNNLLAAVYGNAVDWLITEDSGIHRKAKDLNIADRVLSLSDAIYGLKSLFDAEITPPPAIENVHVYCLDSKDPIFTSIRSSYADFDKWIIKCQKEHRKAFVAYRPGTKSLAAICIYNEEQDQGELTQLGLTGKTLKLCTFKVAPESKGNRLGELLLKPVFLYAESNNYDFIFFSAFPEQKDLISFAMDFGFRIVMPFHGQEIACVKSLKPSDTDIKTMSPLELHIQYGPKRTKFENNSSFIVPIRPDYHALLFPELEHQSHFFDGDIACGNGIKKAYLCNSPCKTVSLGNNIFFYKSGGSKIITTLGIVESTLRSSEPEQIARFVGSRTVFSFSRIKRCCHSQEVLAINFRLVSFIQPIAMSKLIEHGILKDYPQSIIELSSAANLKIETLVNYLRL